jgi:hypothetical protein
VTADVYGHLLRGLRWRISISSTFQQTHNLLQPRRNRETMATRMLSGKLLIWLVQAGGIEPTA